jgi:hypothetical protein
MTGVARGDEGRRGPRRPGGAAVGAAAAGRRAILAWWLASRAVVLAAVAAAQASGILRHGWHASFLAHPFTLLTWWDSRWYRIVASGGYLPIPGRFSDPAFFPLLPLAEHALAAAGAPPTAGAVVLANGGFLLGLLALYELGRHYLPEPDARRAAVYLAVFPMSFVFSMAYPEGIVLPLCAGAGLLALRDRWLAAAACVAAATLARPQGLLRALPLAAIARRAWPRLGAAARGRALAAVLAGPAALASFSAYLWYAASDPLAWTTAEQAWGRSFAPGGLYRALAALATATRHHHAWLYRDAAFCLLDLVLLGAARAAGVPGAWVLAGAATVLMPLASGSFTSDARFGLLALPVFWGLAAAGRRRLLHRLLVPASIALLAAGAFTIPLRFP